MPQGPNYPGARSTEAVDPEFDNDWTGIANIAADDTSYAENFLIDTWITYRLRGQTFGFTVPSTATITGIVVEIGRFDNVAPAAARDYRVQLLNASGALVGDNKADTGTTWPADEGMASYGGASDTWGASPTPAMVNDADFGVVLSAKAVGGSSQPRVDYIRVTIHYSITFGVAAETDTALSFATSKTVSFSPATEADTARSFIHEKLAAYGIAVEGDAAMLFAAQKIVEFGRAAETDAALPMVGVAGDPVTVEYTLAQELEEALEFLARTSRVFEGFEVAGGDMGYGKNRKRRQHATGKGRVTR